VVGAADAVGVVQLTGLASLVAGACSMAALASAVTYLVGRLLGVVAA
jgi:hypothetical protein